MLGSVREKRRSSHLDGPLSLSQDYPLFPLLALLPVSAKKYYTERPVSVGITYDAGNVVTRIVVALWGKAIVGLNPNMIGDNIRYATRPAWTIQPNTRRNVIAGYRNLNGRPSGVHASLKH